MIKEVTIFLLELLRSSMNIDKNINFNLIHIPGGKLLIMSIAGRQEYGVTNDLNGLNLSIYNPTPIFLVLLRTNATSY